MTGASVVRVATGSVLQPERQRNEEAKVKTAMERGLDMGWLGRVTAAADRRTPESGPGGMERRTARDPIQFASIDRAPEAPFLADSLHGSDRSSQTRAI